MGDSEVFMERMRFEVREFAQTWMIPSLEVREMDEPTRMARILSARLHAMIAEREYGEGEEWVEYPTWWDHLKADLARRWRWMRKLRYSSSSHRELRMQLRMCPHIARPHEDHIMWMSYRDRVGNPDPR